MERVKNIIVIAIVALVALVSNTANAQFSYGTHKCKYSEIRPVNKTEWKHIEGTKYAPLSEDATMRQHSEKCSDWYAKATVGGTMTLSNSKFAPMGEIAVGHDFCFTQHGSLGAAVEMKGGMQKMHGMEYKDFTTVENKFMYYIGGNAMLDLSKHSKTMVSVYGGAAYARVSSLYPIGTEGITVKRIGHNTLMTEAGVQAKWRVGMGCFVGVKAFYTNVSTEHVSQNSVGVGVFVQLKKVHKSAPISFKEYKDLNAKINALRSASAE